MALGTLELEASTPYPTLITLDAVTPKDVWPVQQAMESKQVEAAVEEQQAVASMLNLTRRQGS